MEMNIPLDPVCGFCAKNQIEVKRLLKGQTAYICDECVDRCQRVLAQPFIPPSPTRLEAFPTAMYIEDLWWKSGLAAIPPEITAGDLSAAQITELRRALEILSMFKKRPVVDWGDLGVNRKAQHRWPEVKIIRKDITAIRRNWLQYGLAGLIAMIREGRTDKFGEGCASYHHVWHEVQAMTAVEITSLPEGPLFINTGCVTSLKCDPSLIPKVYAIALESQFGRFRFNMIYFKPPGHPEASSFACLHTKVE